MKLFSQKFYGNNVITCWRSKIDYIFSQLENRETVEHILADAKDVELVGNGWDTVIEVEELNIQNSAMKLKGIKCVEMEQNLSIKSDNLIIPTIHGAPTWV